MKSITLPLELIVIIACTLIAVVGVLSYSVYQRGYNSGFAVGDMSGRTSVMNANNGPVNAAIRDAYVRGCTQAVSTALTEAGVPAEATNSNELERACVEDISVPYLSIKER